jgi:hypothetical protein
MGGSEPAAPRGGINHNERLAAQRDGSLSQEDQATCITYGRDPLGDMSRNLLSVS